MTATSDEAGAFPCQIRMWLDASAASFDAPAFLFQQAACGRQAHSGLTSIARSVAGGAADTGPSSTIFWCRLCTEQSLLCTLATLPCLRGGTPPHTPHSSTGSTWI